MIGRYRRVFATLLAPLGLTAAHGGLGPLGPLAADAVDGRLERDGLLEASRATLVDVIARGPVPNDRAFRVISADMSVAKVRPEDVERLAKANPRSAIEILPKVRLATDQAIPIIGIPQLETQGLTGRGVYVGMVDSGFDVTHPAFREANGATRFAWLLDYSRRVRGKYGELEDKFGIKSCLTKLDTGKADDGGECITDPRCTSALTPCAVTQGAIYSSEDIDALLKALPSPPEPLPIDEEGHGTHAMGIVAGSHLPNTAFRGVAPEAKIIGVKSDGSGYTINAGSVIQGIQFIFDRAKEASVPASINLSLSSDFSVRDGTDPLGPAVASFARGPGRIIVIASGNAGDPILGTHQTASVGSGERVRVEFHASRGFPSPRAQIIVSPHAGADIRIGCDAPSGPFVTPVERGRTRSATIDNAIANVIFDPKDFQGRLPAASSSALVVLEGGLATGKDDHYSIVLEGSGTADMWILGGSFVHGVREQTVGSPANHPELIAVGASVSRTGYTTMSGEQLALRSQEYDRGGLIPLIGVGAPPQPGQIAAFSGAGPGPMGVIKPDLVAPGVSILSAATSSREPDRSLLLGTSHCPPRAADAKLSEDDHCLFVDDQHAAATGTSFAAPFVTGAAAILLQADPTLTQEEMRTALQAGVHPHRSIPRFVESASVGELDVPGALEVAKRMRNPIRALPVFEKSWITVNSHYAPADGTRPLEVLVHLRGASNEPADGFDVNRFNVNLISGDVTIPPSRLRRVAPGMWAAAFDVARHGDGFSVTVVATFDGASIAAPVVMPLALDPWQARYPSTASGATCAFAPSSSSRGGGGVLVIAIAALVSALRRR